VRPNLRLIAIILTVAAIFPPYQRASARNKEILPPSTTAPLARGELIGEVRYRCDQNAKPCSITEFMEKARVCALLVVKSEKIRFYRFDTSNKFCESDPGPNGWGKRFGTASVTKSITSTLLGDAIATKFRARTRAEFQAILNKPVDHFVKDLAEQPPRSAYHKVPLDRLIRMRSGVIWRENGWHGWFSDNEQFRRRVRGEWETVTDFASKYRGAAPGGETPEFNYSALDAAMAAVVAEEMLARERLTEFLERGIWHAIGAEAPASWGVDIAETAIGPCCFRATVRDLARFGLLVLNKGRNAEGRQVIPTAWFDIATAGHSPIDAIPGDNPSVNGGCPLDYRHFWWLFPGRSDFTAIGRSGQFVHIYPDTDTVIVQISDWGAWKNGDYLQCETFKVHDALVKAAR